MKSYHYKVVLIVLYWLQGYVVIAQSHERNSLPRSGKQWYVSSAVGVQISGIKREDLIVTNLAPAITVSSVFWLNPSIGMGMTYKGPYFNYIGDDDRHSYSFIAAEGSLNVNEIVYKEKEMKNGWSCILHAGAGFFNNYYYGQSNVNMNGGIINAMKLTNRIDFFIDVSFIVGWDIYQGDEDILPSAVLGFNYLL